MAKPAVNRKQVKDLIQCENNKNACIFGLSNGLLMSKLMFEEKAKLWLPSTSSLFSLFYFKERGWGWGFQIPLILRIINFIKSLRFLYCSSRKCTEVSEKAFGDRKLECPALAGPKKTRLSFKDLLSGAYNCLHPP